MKERINNALNEIDERLIQEAAQADRMERSTSKILRRVLIPAGAAATVAAAGLCFFALSNRPDNGDNLVPTSSGVDLIEPTTDMSVPEYIIPEKNQLKITLPDEMELTAISRERAEQVFFGSEFPYLFYADESRIVFSDGFWGMYIYDRSMEKLTFSADFMELFEEAAGGEARTKPAFWPDCGINVLMVDGEPAFTVGVSFNYDDTAFRYFIDTENGVLKRFEELSEIVGDGAEIVEYQHERKNLYNIAPEYLDSIQIGENSYIGLELYFDSDFGFTKFSDNGLRLIILSEFSIEGDRPANTREVCPFTEEYFDSLEMKDKDLGVYRLEDCHIGFNTADSTYKICYPVLGSGTTFSSGSYSVSGNELTLTDGATGQEFRFTIDGDRLVSVGGKQDKTLYEYGVPEETVELMFKLAYGKNAADGGSQEGIPEKTGSKINLPDEIELTAISRERAEQVFFGASFAELIYADESLIVFSDGGSGMFIYDRGLEKLTYSISFREIFNEAAGGKAELSAFDWPPDHGIDVFMVDGEPAFTVTVSFEQDDTVFKYFVDTENGTLKRFEELSEIVGDGAEILEYDPEINDYNKIKIGENRYIGIEFMYGSDDFEFCEHGLRLIRLTEFSVEDREKVKHMEVCPFTEEYFDSLEMKDKALGVYRLENGIISLNTADSTYRIFYPDLGSGTTLSGGSYAVSGNELTLTDGTTGQKFLFTIDGDKLVSVGGEQDKALYEYVYEHKSDIPENPEELVFKLAYGKSAAEAGSQAGKTSSEAASVNEAITMAHSLKTAEAEISEIIQKNHKQNEIAYDEVAARELEEQMLTSLTSVSGSVTAEDGYDDWRDGAHYGIDIGGDDMEGAEIYAPLAGTVIYVSDDDWGGGMGKHLILDHGSGLSTVYASLGGINVTEGQTVNQGDIIGSVGSTGISTGPHLHFEIREGSEISHVAMKRFITRYTEEPEDYTVSIYDPESAAELIETLSCPLDDEYNVVAEVPGGYFSHTGIDFLAPVGENIYAAQSGEVVLAEYYYGYGNCVMIDHGSGVLTLYAQCSELSVTKGQTVAQGDVIGSVGTTGDTTGAQLHFEIRTDDTPDFDAMEEFMERIGSDIKPWAGEEG